MKLSEIININSNLSQRLKQGARFADIVDLWECLQTQCALYINSETPGVLGTGPKQGEAYVVVLLLLMLLFAVVVVFKYLNAFCLTCLCSPHFILIVC